MLCNLICWLDSSLVFSNLVWAGQVLNKLPLVYSHVGVSFLYNALISKWVLFTNIVFLLDELHDIGNFHLLYISDFWNNCVCPLCHVPLQPKNANLLKTREFQWELGQRMFLSWFSVSVLFHCFGSH